MSLDRLSAALADRYRFERELGAGRSRRKLRTRSTTRTATA